MDNKEELIEEITTAVKRADVSDVDNVITRECSSENYDGVSVTVTGYIVQIRPMLESVELFDEWRVENIGMYGDVPVENDDVEDKEYTHGVTMFCAYIGRENNNDIFTQD